MSVRFFHGIAGTELRTPRFFHGGFRGHQQHWGSKVNKIGHLIGHNRMIFEIVFLLGVQQVAAVKETHGLP